LITGNFNHEDLQELKRACAQDSNGALRRAGSERMKALIAGLGLIGGSMAKALSIYTDYEIYGCDRNLAVVRQALEGGAIHAAFLPEDLGEIDLMFVALRPGDAIRFLKDALLKMKPGALAADLSGVKRCVVQAVDPVARDRGVRFIGAHPMAGREVSGYLNSDASLFKNAPLILTPVDGKPCGATEEISELAIKIGFGRAVVCTPEAHDRMIAYTSQLAHVTSSAYVMSPSAPGHSGFSAGSFRDMTRVARLDADMWAELFDLNHDALSLELGGLIGRLQEIKHAVDGRDQARLCAILSEGNRRKLSLIEREGSA
jgi:prephenate dehydrogenase